MSKQVPHSRCTRRGWRVGFQVIPVLAIVLPILATDANAAILGDVDGDGTVTMEDARKILLSAEGVISSLKRSDNADITQDGVVNASDSFALAQRLSGEPQVLSAHVEYGFDRFTAGAMVLVKVIKDKPFSPGTHGTVQIKSTATGYDSAPQPLTFSVDGRTVYYHWPTGGLLSADYEITATIQEPVGSASHPPRARDGLASWSDRMTLTLARAIPEPQVLSTAVDLFLPYHNIGVHLTRAYRYASSYRLYRGPLGYGWNHAFGVSLTESTDGQVAFFDSDGSTRYFRSKADGTYQPQGNDPSRLTRDPDGTFQLRLPNGDIWHFRSDLLVDYFQDSIGSRVTCAYDSGGHLVNLTDTTNQQIRLDYDAAGRIVRAIDSTGSQVEYAYDDTGDLIIARNPLGGITTYKYDDQHRLLEIQFPDKRRQFFAYDEAGRLQRISGEDGVDAIQLTYDPDHGDAIAADATGNTAVARINDAGLLIELRDGLGNAVRFRYDVAQNLTGVIDENGNDWQLVPDDRQSVTRAIDPNGQSVSATYAGDSNRLGSVTDENRNQTTFKFSQAGELLQTIYPDTTFEANAILYGSLGRTVERRLRDGQIMTYQYDGRGLLIRKAFPDGSQSTYEYDTRGNLISASKDGHRISFDFDVLSRPVRVTYPGGRAFHYEYDEASRRTKMMDPDGRVLQYSYDRAGRLISIGSSTEGVIAQYEYDLAGRATQRRLRNGMTTLYTYDAAGQVINVVSSATSGAVTSQWTYQHDAAGNVTRRDGSDGPEIFSYDRNSRLVQARYAGPDVYAYQYDPAGNRTSVSVNGVAQPHTVNQLSQYTAIGPSAYQYNARGDLIAATSDGGTVRSYQYDAEDLLVGIRLSSQDVLAYTYDALGRLASRSDGNRTINFLWDQDGIIIEEDARRNTIAKYTWGVECDELLMMSRGDKQYYYLHDALLSITELTDGTGNVVERYRYRSFGAPTNASQVSNPFLFTGAFYERVSGLYYIRSRWYSPGLGRFLQPDPAGMLGGVHSYAYLDNSPESSAYPGGARCPCARRFVRASARGFSWSTALKAGSFFARASAVYQSWNFTAGLTAAASAVGSPVFGSGALSSTNFRMRATSNWLQGWHDLSNESPVRTGLGLPGFGGCYEFCKKYPNACRSRTPALQRASLGSAAGGLCPTFIQLPPEGGGMEVKTHQDVSGQDLAAKITVPVNGALVRSDVPIFGVAGGKNFKTYRVEYGEGQRPSRWYPIASSTTPQPVNEIGVAEIELMQGDIDVRGNLATWNTGLKEWTHLPWHPPEDPTDFRGTYTIRLVAVGKDGRSVEDQVTVEVGRVIAQVLPGTAISSDGRVTLRFPEHALPSAFRVYSITPLATTVPEMPKDQELVGAVYTLREPGDRFMKGVVLHFDLGTKTAGRDRGRLGIFSFEPRARRWELLPTVQGNDSHSLQAVLYGLPEPAAYFAVFASRERTQSSLAAPAIAPRQPEDRGQALLVFDTFDKDTGQWAGRDREFGATVTRDQVATPNGTHCLKVTRDNFGGSFSVTAYSTPFRADTFPIVTFDYKIGPGVRTDFYVRLGTTWYNIGFSDDENNFRHRDVNMVRIGKIDGVIADNEWHSASFNLDQLLSNKTRRRLVEEIVMADWDVTGYMKLDFGRNRRGATYYIDNFKIRRSSPRLADAGRQANQGELLLDDFSPGRQNNLLGGAFDVFSDPGTYNCSIRVVSDEASGSAKAPRHYLSMTYDVARNGAYGGFWSHMLGVSVEAFDQLWMRVRPLAGGTAFAVGLKPMGGVEVKVPAASYIGPPDPSGWRELAIPLAAFKASKSLSAMDVFSITFTNAMGSGQGQLFVADIKFQNGVSHIPVADFQQRGSDVNDLSQKSWVFTHGAAAISASAVTCGPPKSTHRCLRLSYGGSIGLDLGSGDFSYAAWVTGLGGLDASNARYLSLKIRGQLGGERLNVYLDDGATRKPISVEKHGGVTTSWREVLIPLSAYAQQGIDLTHLEELQVVFEWEPGSGTLYIDDIVFTGKRPER